MSAATAWLWALAFAVVLGLMALGFAWWIPLVVGFGVGIVSGVFRQP